MNLEKAFEKAMKTGKPIRRSGWGENIMSISITFSAKGRYYYEDYMFPERISQEDISSDDWEVDKKERETIRKNGGRKTMNEDRIKKTGRVHFRYKNAFTSTACGIYIKSNTKHTTDISIVDCKLCIKKAQP